MTDLGNTDVLISRKFLEYYDLKQSYTKNYNRLEWLLDMPVQPYFDQRVFVDINRSDKLIVKSHQLDAERRDALINTDDHRRRQAKLAALDGSPKPKVSARPTASASPTRPSSFVREVKERLRVIED